MEPGSSTRLNRASTTAKKPTPPAADLHAYARRHASIKDARTVVGDVLEAGAVVQNLTREVNPDGKLLTIAFYQPHRKQPTSIEVWDRQ